MIFTEILKDREYFAHLQLFTVYRRKLYSKVGLRLIILITKFSHKQVVYKSRSTDEILSCVRDSSQDQTEWHVVVRRTVDEVLPEHQ